MGANVRRQKLKPPMSIGQVVARSGVPTSTLHYYEELGLIRSSRTAGNQRRYTRDVLRRLGVVKAAQRVGIPLASIQCALDTLPNDRTPNDTDWKRLSRRWRVDLDDRIARLSLLRDRLTGCIGCGCLSVKACPLLNPDDKQGIDGCGPTFLEPS
jgi:MerR family redox-sensitive transcriptional activator SoxR